MATLADSVQDVHVTETPPQGSNDEHADAISSQAADTNSEPEIQPLHERPRGIDKQNGISRASNGLLLPNPPSLSPQNDSSRRRLPSPVREPPSALRNGGSRPSSTKGKEQSPFRPIEEDAQRNGTTTPPATRKGVQFSNETEEWGSPEEPASDSSPTAGDRADQKNMSLYAKLRALATSQGFVHTRSTSAASSGAPSPDTRDQDGYRSASSTRPEVGISATIEESDAELDTDVEDSGPERSRERPSRADKPRRQRLVEQADTVPPSPHSPMRSGLVSAPTGGIGGVDPPPKLTRSATDTNMDVDAHGLSEGDTPKASQTPWTPRHPLRGLSYGGQRKAGEGTPEGREGRQPLGLRMLTNFPSNREPASAQTPDITDTPRASRRRLLTERGTTLSAQKWRSIKSKLQLLGQSKKKERTQDHQKSAELMAELAAGAPAALMLASMFQRDEHGDRRIPVLLEQLKVQVTDSEIDRVKEPDAQTPGDRHLIFKIDLEYGNGINRMKWVIKRSLRDFANLHVKYKLHYSSEKLKGRGDSNRGLPKFPRKAFPYLKMLGDESDEEDEDDEQDQDASGPEAERPKMKLRQSFANSRRKSSLTGPAETPNTPSAKRDERWQDKERQRQRRLLETYLQKMIKFMLFKADSNRLCKFLEVSALGMRLAAEGSYHGKEGYLMIRSAKGLDFRKSMTPANIKARHTPKWFLVRHSYVVCVDSPEGMHIYDVFLFDSDFRIQSTKSRLKDKGKVPELAVVATEKAKHPQHHRLRVYNSERQIKLIARNERQLHQFEGSIRSMVATSQWAQPQRFNSFAPVRQKCFAQWLVDGRDHMWVVSRALSQAKDVIYIHDWWLSPELYMRRPPAISQKWRLDRLLKQKAEEGVKIFVIVYRNVESAVPIDSQYTKFSLLDLHPNVYVQRSPNQFRQNTFFWAHHEKLCIVDHTLAFVGGIDLCFGRWDTPQHTLIDDKPTGFEMAEGPKDADHCQLWPGKDYSNPRIQDFHALNKPYEEMYDRQKVARMPWHDISMQVVGQPARDLTRHFVQRWNYILRQRKPTRPTPFLLPPPDFNPADLEALGLDGTCEVQILRSAGPWSLGTPDKTEHSIMTAYMKMIEESEHFIYMENQFFISSCETDRVTIHNKIGDALVERITRAAKNDEIWRAVIIIPLIPGFQNTVEQEGGTSVRLIMQYQYRSICRGESSIFGRLRSNGIDPEDYIQFYSLRQWGRLGPNKALMTEQLYIHAKCMVADDRVAIIGSANVNERSMMGNRDSEVAAIVRDTDMVWSKMGGRPYQVGRFPHTLRMRLMREHLGLDVDKIMEEAQAMENEVRKSQAKDKPAASRPDSPQKEDDDYITPLSANLSPTAHVEPGDELREELLDRLENLNSFNHDVDWEQAGNPNLKSNRKLTEDSRVTKNDNHRKEVAGHGKDRMVATDEAGYGVGRDSTLVKGTKEVLLTSMDAEGHKTLEVPRKHNESIRLPSYVTRLETPNPPMPPKPSMHRLNSEQLGLPMLSQLPALPLEDDTDIGGPPLVQIDSKESNGIRHHPLMSEMHRPMVDRDCMSDPVHDAFIFDTWHTIAENNTKIYRAVFRCMPDNLVRDWHDYHQYVAYEQRFNHLQGNDGADDKSSTRPRTAETTRTGPPGANSGLAAAVNAGNLQAISKIPTDLSVRGGELMEKMKGMLPEMEENSKKEKEAELRNWAKEKNMEQAERLGKDLHRKDEVWDEKSGLAPVPEGQEDTSRRTTPSDDTTVNNVNGSPPGTATTMSTDFVEKDKNNEKVKTRDRAGTTGSKLDKITSGGSTATSTFVGYSEAINMNNTQTVAGTSGQKRRRRATTRGSRKDFSASDDILSVEEAEELLGMVQGTLVLWPYDWLERVEAGSNWLFPFDQITPIEIYV